MRSRSLSLWLGLLLCVVAALSVCRSPGFARQAPRRLVEVPADETVSAARVYAHSYALLVGIDDYTNLPKDLWLQYAVNDVTALKAVLVRSYGFEAANVTVLTDAQATRLNIEHALAQLADKRRVKPDDRILIFFAGHGQTVKLPTGGEMGFLIPSDADIDLTDAANAGPYLDTCIKMNTIWDYLESSPARHALLLADACYSGLMTRSRSVETINPETLAVWSARRALQVVTAGGQGETSSEDPKLGHGAFTFKLLEELKARAAEPGQVFTTTELFGALRTSVANLTGGKQTPQIGNYDTEGEFLFITTDPALVSRPAPLPKTSGTERAADPAGPSAPRPRPVSSEQTQALAERVHAIFEKSCTGCHGSTNPPKGINLTRRSSLLETKAVVPQDAGKSKLIEVVESGYMPLGAQKLPDADIKALRDWIDAGAPDWVVAAKPQAGGSQGGGASNGRKLLSEATLLAAILHDLQTANERDRPYLRYYSIANLYNNPEVSEADLNLYRTALGKLTNSLSWSPDIVAAKTIDAEHTLLRIDLRDFDWTPAIWQKIIAAYPYGLQGRNLSGELRQIQTLSGAELPYIRVDWFVANASVPPLYHDILELPDNLAALEGKLGVDAARDVDQEKAVRGGLRNSGVSRNNRAVERHRSLYGAYWKSFDFADNQDIHNIFKNPVDLQPNGGEFIFNLPNGLQAYFVANGQGKRLDDAPINIVRDRTTNPDDPVVHNGRSCIGCHFQGMNRFHDEVRNILETQQKAEFDVDKALALYVPQAELDRFMDQDTQKFENAVRATGSQVPDKPLDEPVNMLSQRYLADMSVAQAAADAGLDEKEFQRRIGKSSELEQLGFGPLQGENGGIKRDAWEAHFGTMVTEIRLGDFLKPTEFHGQQAQAAAQDNRRTVSVGTLTAPDPQQAQQARQALIFWLNQSDDLRLVSRDGDYNLKGTLIVKSRDEVTVTVGDAKQNVLEEATGSPSDLHFLTQQLANRVNFKVSGNWLPAATSTVATTLPAAASALPADAVQKIQQAVGNGGSTGIALSVDRGPGATYQFGEEVQLRFKVDRDCFLTIYDMDSQGNVSLLFPNQFAPDNQVQAGVLYSIPDPKDAWKIEVGGVPGQETMIAIATQSATDLPGLAAFRQDPKGKSLGVVKRGASAFAQDVKQSVGGAGGATSASVRFFTVK